MAHIPTSVPASPGDDRQVSDEEHERRLAWLANVKQLREDVLERRGGEPIPRELVDRLLEETRGGSAGEVGRVRPWGQMR